MGNENFLLPMGQTLQTENPNESFGLVQGRVMLFMVPIQNGVTQKAVPLYEINEGKVFPAVAFQDFKGVLWQLRVKALGDDATLREIPAVTDRIRQTLTDQLGISQTAVRLEGFEGALRNYCVAKMLTDKNEVDLPIKGSVFNPIPDTYTALACLCRVGRIPFSEWNVLQPKVGKAPSVPELAEAANLICRKLTLEDKWFAQDCGLLLCMLDDQLVALVPGCLGGYRVYHPSTGKSQRLTAALAKRLGKDAYGIQRTLPDRSVTKKELWHFIWASINKREFLLVAVLSLLGVLIGLLLPLLNQYVYDDYIPMGDFSMLQSMCLLIGTFMLGNASFSLVKSLLEFRIARRTGYALQDAAFHRVFQLPQQFFHRYDNGDLAQRLCSFDSLASDVASKIVSTVFSSVFSLFYLGQMIHYSKKLSLWGGLLLLVFCALNYLLSARIIKYEKEIVEQAKQAKSQLFQYVDGIQKIRLAGAEERVIGRYMDPFTKQQKASIRENRISAASAELSSASGTIISMIFYATVVQLILKNDSQVTAGSFMAFNTAFGSFSGAITGVVQAVIGYQRMKPGMEQLSPILSEAPETVEKGKTIAGKLRGRIEVDHVSFAYPPKDRFILNDLSLTIEPGDYVGIVGESGSGKTTLLKLLLGFETPDQGVVRFDGQDLSTLDKRSVRKQIGTVLQNGGLMSGTIYDNITITANDASLDDVNKAIRAAGLEKDIRQMPMGLQTLVSEDSRSISGGQRQRILIARVFCAKPSILLFDEATSALDNPTQELVCKTLEAMQGVTRIVVAHRLSTIQKCSKIIVLGRNGKINQSGTYETLMHDRKGLFYQLVKQQLVCKNDTIKEE